MIGWNTMEFGSDIHVPLRMTCNNFGDSFLLHHHEVKLLISQIIAKYLKTNKIPIPSCILRLISKCLEHASIVIVSILA